MIRAIIFDCYGVLATSSYIPFKDKHFGNDQKLIDEFMEYEDRSSRGEITIEEAERGFAIVAGISYEQAEKELRQTPRNAELFDYIGKNLKGKYKIGYLSNVAKDLTKNMFTEVDMALFDDVVLSFQVGIAKPDVRIFKLAAERLGLDPAECVFVDDNESYLGGAEEVGMKTVHYTDLEKFKADMNRLVSQDA